MSWQILRRARPRTAAEWFAARRGRSDASLDRQFHDWLAEHPSHVEEFALCEIAWEVSRDAALQVPVPHSSGRGRARLLRPAAVVTAAAFAASLIVWWWPPTTQRWATAPGEQRAVTLADGSRVTLNTRTRLAVRFTYRTREVALEGGEAFFEVAKDASRPFTVRTTLGTARAVGTRFNVYLEDRQLTVTTEHGQVLVGATGGDSGVLVDAGRQAEVGPDLAQPIVRTADLTSILNWRNERLEADDVPLAIVLRDFSRYTQVPVRPATPEIGAVRVTAVVRTGDVDSLEAMLMGALGLEVDRRDGEMVVVRASREPSSPH
jgi:transmembrane sensor